MKELNWNEFLINLLKNNMLQKDNDIYYRNITLEDVQRFLQDKSDTFIQCFWKAFALARKENK